MTAKDEDGKPLFGHDKDGNPVYAYDEMGKPVTEPTSEPFIGKVPANLFDKNDEPIIDFTEDGEPIVDFD